MDQPRRTNSRTLSAIMPRVDFCSLRIVREVSESLAVRQDVLQPVSNGDDPGGHGNGRPSGRLRLCRHERPD